MPIVGRCPHFLEPDVSSCFVNTGASHVEARKANRLIVQGSCILRMHYMWSLQNNFSQWFLFLLWSMLPLSDIQYIFCFIFPFLFIYHSFHVWPKWFSTFHSEWSSFNCSNFSTEIMVFVFFSKLRKIIPGYKESLFCTKSHHLHF